MRPVAQAMISGSMEGMKRQFLLWCGLLSIIVGLAALLLAYRGTVSPGGAVDSQSPDTTASSSSSEPQEVSRQDAVDATMATGHAVSRSHAAAAKSAIPTSSEVNPQVKELMTRLTAIGSLKGPITVQQAEAWKQALSDLAAQGPAAVAGIRDFLAKNEEIDFRRLPGGILLGELSMRIALIKTLDQIRGTEAQDLMVQTLGASTVPLEITLLGNYLEQQAPGQYRSETLNAAGEVFNMAAQGQLPDLDVGPMLQMLRNLDPATEKQTIEKLAPQYGMYAAITFAGLDASAGLPSLLRSIDSPAEGGAAGSQLGLQMLAQMSAQSPEARSALLQRVRSGQISDAAWPMIAMGLGGDQYSMFSFSADGQPEIPSLPGLKLYHMESGNQNFYSVPAAFATPDQVDQRRQLIDQLLATNPGSDAVQALKQAKVRLSGLARN